MGGHENQTVTRMVITKSELFADNDFDGNHDSDNCLRTMITTMGTTAPRAIRLPVGRVPVL